MTNRPTEKSLNFYSRITASVPLLVTVIVHVVLIAVAGYFFVSEQLVGKKKSFEASNASDNVFQKKVEHRLQVARKGGGSASATPVSASRIFTVDTNALQLPPPPELNLSGASSLMGVGFGAAMGGPGGGTGFNTGGGNSAGLGRGFMSLSFLGMTDSKASKVVFVIDVGTALLSPKKGGFEAFTIIRAEIMKLISRLPPNTSFGVVVYTEGAWFEGDRGGELTPYQLSLVPATSANKNLFFDWMKPINLTPTKIGFSSIPVKTAWRPKALPAAGLDDSLSLPTWVNALRCALEMQPDTIYVIAGNPGRAIHPTNEQVLAKRLKVYAERIASSGRTPEQVKASREASREKATQQLAAVNAKLTAQGKSPIIVNSWGRIFEPEVQAALKKVGATIVLDDKGWTDKNGKALWHEQDRDYDIANYNEVGAHISQLQRALLKERAAVNIFLFVGPDEQPKEASSDLSKISSRNGGMFKLLTTSRLKELAASKE